MGRVKELLLDPDAEHVLATIGGCAAPPRDDDDRDLTDDHCKDGRDAPDEDGGHPGDADLEDDLADSDLLGGDL